MGSSALDTSKTRLLLLKIWYKVVVFLSPTEFMSEILILLISSQFENKLCIAVKLSFRKHSFILL